MDDEVGIVLSLKQKQQLLTGLKEAQTALKNTGQGADDASKKAEVSSGRWKTLTSRLEGVSATSKRAGKVGGALFGVLASNSQGALGPISEVYDKLQGVGTALDDSRSKAGKWAIGLGAALTGAGAVLGTIASKEQTAEGQLKAAITAAGGNYEDFDKQIRKNIKTGEHYGNTAATTMTVLNRLTLATHDPRKAMQLYNSVLQIAAARHMSVEKVALTVGRAINGQARGLNAFGFKLKDTNKLQSEAVKAQKEHAGAVETLKKAQQNLVDEEARLNDSHKKTKTSSTAVASAYLSVENATNSYNKAVFSYGKNSAQANLASQKLAISQAKYNDVQHAGTKQAGLSVSEQISLRKAHEAVAEAQKKVHDTAKQATASQKDLAGAGDIVNQVVKQTNQYMGGQADAAANTFTGHMHMIAAVIDDKVAAAGGHLYKTLNVLGPSLMGIGAIVETGVIGKLGKGTKLLMTWNSESKIVSATTKIWTGVQAAFNLVMDANPIMLTVLAIVALAAIFVVAYKKSATFRAIVHDALHAVAAAGAFVWDFFKKHWPLLAGMLFGPFGFAVAMIIKHWNAVEGFFSKLPGRIGGFFSSVGSTILFPFEWAFNKIADAWNNTAGKLSFHVPGWVPEIGGKGWSMPTIPHWGSAGESAPSRPLSPDAVGVASITIGGGGGAIGKLHSGGHVVRDQYVNMQPSEEIVKLPDGTTVVPLDNSEVRNMFAGDGGPKVFQVLLDRKVLAEAVYQDARDQAARR